MSRRIKIDNFGAELEKILEDYGQNVTEKTRAAVLEAAKVAKQETKAGAPVRKGKGGGEYRKGWAVKEDAASRLRTEAIVYNRSRYQLAHLLEKGHASRNGGRVAARVHIKPAEEHAIKNMEEAIQRIAEES